MGGRSVRCGVVGQPAVEAAQASRHAQHPRQPGGVWLGFAHLVQKGGAGAAENPAAIPDDGTRSFQLIYEYARLHGLCTSTDDGLKGGLAFHHGLYLPVAAGCLLKELEQLHISFAALGIEIEQGNQTCLGAVLLHIMRAFQRGFIAQVGNQIVNLILV